MSSYRMKIYSDLLGMGLASLLQDYANRRNRLSTFTLARLLVSGPMLVWMKGLGEWLWPVGIDAEVPLLPEMVSKINLSKQPFSKYYRE